MTRSRAPFATLLLSLCVSAAAVACSGSAPLGAATDVEGPGTAEDVSDLTAASVVLRVPLLDDDGKLLSKHNSVLTAAGLGSFPDVVEIAGGKNGLPAKNASKQWQGASALTDKAYEKLKLSIAMRSYGEPISYETKDPNTTICYKGNPLWVASLVANLSDDVFSDQLTIHGWRYRQKKELDSNIGPKEEATFPTIWKSWRGQGAAVLMLTASSDDGGETNVGLIRKCP